MPTVDLDKFKKLNDNVRKASKSEYVTFGSAGELSLLPSYIPYGIPSGLPQMDWALGRNGYPAGRIIELWGFEMSGKSAAAMAALAGVQAIGGFGCWLETEHTFDPERLITAGVDLDRILLAESDSIEGVFSTIDNILDQRQKMDATEPFLIVVDSVGAVTSEQDIDRFDKGNWNTSQVGIDAKQTKGLLRILNSRLAKAQCTTLFVNHGVETAATSPYAKKGKSSGGHAIKFYATVRAEFVKIGNIKDEEIKDRRAGQNIQINLEKLKNTKLNRSQFELELIDGLFDPYKGLYAAMLDSELIHKAKGSQVSTFDPGQGPDEVRTFKTLEFREFVAEYGGFGNLYRGWIEWAVSKGKMRLWGN